MEPSRTRRLPSAMPVYRIGCTGWGEEDWRPGFYGTGTSPGEFLARYARVFSFTEVNKTYHEPTNEAETARWAERAPPGFLFAIKANGTLSHDRIARLREPDDELHRFLYAIRPLRFGGKLGPVVLELPASFTFAEGAAHLERFLSLWPRDLALVVELRDESWWRQETYRMLEEAGASLVWSLAPREGTKKGAIRTPPVLVGDRAYLRLIGPDRALTKFDRVQRDDAGELAYWRDRIRDEAASAREVYLVFNNHFQGFAPATAVAAARIFDLPVPDLSLARRDLGQQGLDAFG